MDFWATFWATAWGAIAGAAVGTIGAWLFGLDLARRDQKARKLDRTADETARNAEREEARSERQSERELERQQQRQDRYQTEMNDRWIAIANAIANLQAVKSDPNEKKGAYNELAIRKFAAWSYARDEDARIADRIRLLDETALVSNAGGGRVAALIYMYLRGDVNANTMIDLLDGVPQYVHERLNEAKSGQP